MNATIWIRVANEEKWRGIKDKSRFVNDALTDTRGRAVRVGDKLFVANGAGPLKRYDATTEETYTPVEETA